MSKTHTRSLHCYLVYIMVRFQRGSIASSRDGLADRAVVIMSLAQMSTNVQISSGLLGENAAVSSERR